MNYEKIILELMGRIQTLEEQMFEVKNYLASQKLEEFGDDVNDEDSELGDFTRSQARDKAIKIIQSKFPDYYVEKASRKEGSGIKIIKPDSNVKKAIIIKYFHSKTYIRTGKVEHSWHTVNLDEIIGTIYDFCLFSVLDKQGGWNFLLFEPDELGIYRDENRSTNSDLLYLYFVIDDGKATEVREKTTDVTDHLNNWGVLK